MSLIHSLVCVQCQTACNDQNATTCPACGPDEGILEIRFNLAAAARSLNHATLALRPHHLWRYRELLPLKPTHTPDLDHIGFTPLIETPRLAKKLDLRRLRLKDDSRSASGSFKDRASAIGVEHARQIGFTELACASTGNAATSLAYCAAATGLNANIFVSHNVPEGKLAQLLAYGARVFRVQGSYAQAYELCSKACKRLRWYNRNAAINPYLVEGKKTAGLEIAEQARLDPPDWVVCSVGDGCSIAGVAKGLHEMRALRLIDWKTRMLGVQAENVAPIVQAARTGKLDRSTTGDTYADSINVPVPRNWRKAVRAVKHTDGAWVTVSDDEIRYATRLTGRLAGIFAEPAAATAIAGLAAARKHNIIPKQASVIACITGNGLKDIHGALTAVGAPNDINPDLDDVLRHVDHNS